MSETNTALAELLANVTTTDTADVSDAFRARRETRTGYPTGAPDGPTAAAWLGMTGDEIDALDDKFLMARIIRFRHQTEKRRTGPVVVYTPTYTPDPEDAAVTVRLMAENRAKNLRNSLGAKYETANLASPLPGQAAVYQRLSRWADCPRPDTLVLWGSVGTGKTHAAAATGIAAAGTHRVPRLVTWEDLADAWMPSEKVPDDLMARRSRTRGRVLDAHVLIIDDMYRRKPSEYTSAELAALLAERQGSGRLTIITTNVASLDTPEGEAFVAAYPFAERVMDRLMDAENIHVAGASLRGRV
jgi:DNA replication protein DnaC